jgi:hypothetical protein
MNASTASLRFGGDWADALTAAAAPLLFGIRLWASVCLALFVAFSLDLDNPYWAGASAAIVCQPQLGASLRKGWFRTIGTIIGATVIVVLTAGSDRLSRAAGAVVRCLRFCRHGAAQLRVLLCGPRRIHRCHRRLQHARRDRRP